MKLKSGSTFWTQIDVPAHRYEPLTRDLSCAVAIIGGGITGALVARYLTRAGIHVAVLDRRQMCEGSTSASTGLLQYEIDTHLVDLMADMGHANACRAYRATERTLRAFEGLVSELGNDCGLARRESLYLASRQEDVAVLRAEEAARRCCGIEVSLLTAEALREQFGITRPGALLSPRALQVDPYRLAAALIESAASHGADVFGETEVTDYVPQNNGILLRTAGGCEVRAGHVVFATGYETPSFIRLNVQLKSTYALVSEPLATPLETLERCLMWETARPYLYVRSAPGERVLVGGEDIDQSDPAVRDGLLPRKIVALVRQFRTLFPACEIVPEAGWAGTFAETEDGLPLIGPSPEFPRGSFALGYGGNGITFSLLAAEIIRDALLGRVHPDADVFRLGR